MRSFMLGLAAAAVFFQGLVPAGYMPGTRAELATGAWVVQCPGQGEVLVAAPQDPHAHHHHHDGGAVPAPHQHAAGHTSCVYAVAAAAVLPVAIAVIAPLPPNFAMPPEFTAAEFRGQALVTLPPARGPPSYS